MNERQWLDDYLARYRRALFDTSVLDQLIALKSLLLEMQGAGRKAIVVGNGGSAGTASHFAIDITKNAGIRCVTFNESSLITCLANDCGYEAWVQKALELYADDGDVAILISASGKSENMLAAARYARTRGLTVVTLTGFAADNPLRGLGHLNLWADSLAYNVVEVAHQLWLLAVVDLIIGRAEYSVSGRR